MSDMPTAFNLCPTCKVEPCFGVSCRHPKHCHCYQKVGGHKGKTTGWMTPRPQPIPEQPTTEQSGRGGNGRGRGGRGKRYRYVDPKSMAELREANVRVATTEAVAMPKIKKVADKDENITSMGKFLTALFGVAPTEEEIFEYLNLCILSVLGYFQELNSDALIIQPKALEKVKILTYCAEDLDSAIKVDIFGCDEFQARTKKVFSMGFFAQVREAIRVNHDLPLKEFVLKFKKMGELEARTKYEGLASFTRFSPVRVEAEFYLNFQMKDRDSGEMKMHRLDVSPLHVLTESLRIYLKPGSFKTTDSRILRKREVTGMVRGLLEGNESFSIVSAKGYAGGFSRFMNSQKTLQGADVHYMNAVFVGFIITTHWVFPPNFADQVWDSLPQLLRLMFSGLHDLFCAYREQLFPDIKVPEIPLPVEPPRRTLPSLGNVRNYIHGVARHREIDIEFLEADN